MPPPRTIVALPGEGIGPEVMYAAQNVLEAGEKTRDPGGQLSTTVFSGKLCKRIRNS